MQGFNEEANPVAYGEFLADMPNDYMVFSTDKKANERCWTERHWLMMVDYMQTVLGSDLDDLTASHLLSKEEGKDNSAGFDVARIKHQYATFIVDVVMLHLMSGISPTGGFNRLMSEAEVGTVTRDIYGKTAYEECLADRETPVKSENLFWLSTWKYGMRTKSAIMAPTADINSGDDKIMAMHTAIVRGVKVDCNALAQGLVSRAAWLTSFAYEIAFVPCPETNCGRKSVMEFCSSVVGLSARASRVTVAPPP